MDWKGLTVPASGWYSTIARFDGDDLQREAWSIVLDEFQQGDDVLARAGFLTENAPWDRLKAGVVFEMMEGARTSARVEVL
jgi:hypothetical protein